MWSTSTATTPPPANVCGLLTLDTDRLIVRPLASGDADAVRTIVGELRPGWLEWSIASYAQLEALHQPP